MTVRLAIDWTMENPHHLRTVSLIVGRRAAPIYWRAYDASVLKGRMKLDALAVIRRAVSRIIQAVGTRRVMVTTDRGCADVTLFPRVQRVGHDVHSARQSGHPRLFSEQMVQVGSTQIDSP